MRLNKRNAFSITDCMISKKAKDQLQFLPQKPNLSKQTCLNEIKEFIQCIGYRPARSSVFHLSCRLEIVLDLNRFAFSLQYLSWLFRTYRLFLFPTKKVYKICAYYHESCLYGSLDADRYSLFDIVFFDSLILALLLL